jgi:hypothetical protein
VGRNKRRRPTGARRATFAAVALMLGGSGLVAANVYASATEGSGTSQVDGWGAGTIGCPDVGAVLTDVPEEARAEVDKELAALDQQIAQAYQQLQGPVADREAAENDVVKPLSKTRSATLDRIAAALEKAGGTTPQGFEELAGCSLREPETKADDNGGEDQNGRQGDGQDGQDGQQGDGQQGNGGQGGNGPVPADYADITTAPPVPKLPEPNEQGSTGTFTTSCGVNENGLFNSDNVIVAPGVSNGAHHFHDYVGNQSNDAFADDAKLAAAETTCEDQRDKSSYFWPVLRLQNGKQERDANSPGGGLEGNVGEIVTPKEATLTFIGNPRSKVTEMPKLLRIITGDAKSFVNGTANANASWSCTGFEDRAFTDKYPLCPEGSDVVRTFRFQSCWDGRNIDSANHRTHVAFMREDGTCPDGFQAIPQLIERIVYDVDAPSLQDGGKTVPLFAVDSFPEQLHKPVTDHGDFINVFDEELMKEAVKCINEGRTCGAGAQAPGDGGNGGGNGGDQATQSPEPTKTAGKPADGKNGNGGGNGEGGDGKNAPVQGGDNVKGDDNGKGGNGDEQAQPLASPSATQRPETTSPQATSPSAPVAAAQPPVSGTDTQAQGGAGGSLAETGAKLWPAALGAVLLIGGFVLLRQTRRRYG